MRGGWGAGLANAVLSALGRGLARFLTQEVPGARRVTTNSERALRRTIRPGDVLLVEGHTRVSTAIKYLTQSTWSHAALHVGEIPGTGHLQRIVFNDKHEELRRERGVKRLLPV